ncbi:ESPR-type extended signal peptide-containing protein [Acinetobacter sp. A47]|uniref:ESPR-type extended signal peptide-containing protein n=1 Tax=Acinetobacter sp. A47 TaxID=1561217 RepID=UPI00056DA371|nr:ESPR-type extended signal peptide-containing protein [Acinetobacter sp. A47]
MNKIYRLVWNKSLNLWTVVSENARGVTKKRNVTSTTDVNTTASFSSNSKKDQQYQPIPTLIALTISSVLLSTGTFAATNTGGGTANNGTSMAISPTASQCNGAGEASVNGGNGVAIGCGSAISGTDTGFQQGLVNRRGTGSINVPATGTAGVAGASTAVGRNNKVSNPGGATVVGNSNVSNGNGTFQNVAIGQGNLTSGQGYNTALGIGNEITSGNSNVAIGVNNRAAGNTSIAMGRSTWADADYSIAQGNSATVASGATSGIAMGHSATTKGLRGIAIGSSTSNGVNYDPATAANADGTDSIALGTGAKATGNQTTAVGRQAEAAGNNAAAYGNEAKARGASSVAMGDKAVATNANDVALGSGSQTSTASGAAYRTGTAAPSSVVSVGTAGNERRIQNVSAGAADTDAVNVSQLKSVQDGVDQLGQTTADALGGGAAYDPATGAISNPNYTVNGNNVNNVGDAITALDKGWNLQSNGANSAAVKAGDTVDIGTADGEENLQVTKDGNNIKYSLNRDLKVDSVTTGDTVINNDGMTIANGPSVTKSGIDAAGNTISNVGPGVAGTDAVNKDQLDQAGQDLTDKGFGLTAQDGTTVQKKLGEAVDVIGADDNISTKVQDGKVAIELAKDLNVNSITAGDTIINNDGMTISGGPSVTKSGIDAGGTTISNVAPGVAGTDAVNKDQLDQAGQDLTDKGFGLTAQDGTTVQKKLGEAVDVIGADDNISTKVQDGKVAIELAKDLNVNSITAGDTVVNSDGVSIANGPSMTKSGIDAAGNKITNVADGDINPDSKDAINGSQLAKNAQSVSDALGGGSTVNPDGTVTAPNYTVNGNNINNVGDAITELDKGWNLQSNGANSGAVKAGDTVDIGTADGEENLQVAKEGNNIKYSLNRDLKVDSVTAGDTVINNDGMTIANGPSVTKSGIDAAGNTISNVGPGVAGTDAVNKDQLDQAGQDLTDKGFGLTAQDGTTIQKKLGEAVDVIGADDNISTKVQDGKVAIELAKDLNVNSITAGDTVVNSDGVSIANGPSMTKSGIDAAGNKITNVADGDINPDSKDAINGSQLAKNAQSVSDALGGGSTVNPDGTVTAPNYTVNGNNVNNVGDAITELDKGWNLQSNGANSAAVKAGDTVDIGTADGEENLQVAKEGNNIKYSLNRDLKVDSVTAGDTVINNDGMTISGGPSVTKSGIDAAGNTISNVGPGVAGTDAVNKDQLDQAGQDLTDKGFGLTAQDGTTVQKKLGEAVDVIGADDNISTKVQDGKVAIELAKDLNVNSITAGDTVMNSDGVSIANGPSMTKSGINAAGQKITGVAPGTVNADSTDAVNGSQLHAQGEGVKNIIGGDTAYDPDTGRYTNPDIGGTGKDNINDAIGSIGQAAKEAKTTVTQGDNIVVTESKNTDGSTNYEVATARDVNFDSVKVGDVNIDGTTGKITGVADGDINPDSKDAINGSQLAKNAQSVSDALGGGSTVNPDGTVTAPNYTVNGNNVNNVGDAITELDKGWNLQSNGANSGAVKAGDTVDIGTADGEENLQVAKEGNNIKYSLNRDLKVDSVTAGNTRLDNAGVEVKDAVGNSTSIVAGGTIVKDAQGNSTAQTAAGTTIKNAQGDSTTLNGTGLAFIDANGQPVGPSVGRTGIDAGGLKITGVAEGEVAAGSKDAVNGGQLNDTADSVGNILGGGVSNEGGKLNGPFTVNDKGYDTVADAIKGETAAAKTEVEAGKNMTVDSKTGADGQTIYTVATADDVEFNSVKVGDVNIDGATGKISGVTDGTVAAGSKDAINGSQLHGVADSVKNSIGGETVLNPDGSITTSNVGNTGKDNIHDAIDSVRGAAIAAKSTVTQGDNMRVTESKNVDGSTNYEVATARDVNFDSVKVGDVNIDGATGKITGVADGDINPDSKDAINGSQLAKNAQSVSDALGGGSTVNPDGTVTAPNYTVNGNNVNNVGDAITELDKGWTLQSNGTNAGAVKAGDTVDIGTVDGEENLQVAKEGNNIKYSLNRDLKVDSVTAGDTVINSDGMTVTGGPSITKAGINAGNKKITGVAPGTVSADSTDAINGSQLHAQGEGVKNIIGGNTQYDPDTGKYTNPDIGGTGQDNINDAIGAVGAAAKAAKTTVTEGDNMVVTETKNADGSTSYKVATAKDVKFDSVTATDDEGNETVLTATGTQVKDGEGNEAEYGAKGISLKDADGNGTVVNSTGLGFVDPDGNHIGPSITAKGIDAGNTVITGVAPGRVAADSQDAINGSQLKGVSDSVAKSIGGNTTVNPDGTINTSNIGGIGKDNINDAIGAVGDAAKAAKSSVTEGKNIVVKESKNADGSSNYEVSTAPDLDVDSVTAGGTRVDGDGLKIEGGPSVTKDGIDAGDKKVTGIADGDIAAGSKDAVNGGQLKGVSDSVAGAIGGNTTVNPDGTISTSNIGGTGHDNINDAIASVKNDAKAAKSSVSNKDGNISVTENKKADGSTDYEVGLSKDIKVDSVTAKDVNANQVNVTGNQGTTTITGGGVSITGPKGEQGPSMTTDGINAGGKKVTGVADGTIAKGSQDGINGGQLHQSYQDVGAALGGGAGYDPDKGWKGPSYNVAGGSYNNVGDALGAIDDRVTNLGDQMQQAFYDTNKRIGKLEDKMSAGIAATAALENAPFVAGKLTMAAGAAYYNDQSAIGVTFRRTADNGRWSLTTGAAMGSEGNSPLVRVGVSTVID